MTVHIRTRKDWKYREDPDGNAVTVLPRHQTFSLDDDVGLLAIAEDAADAIEPLDEAQTQRLAIVRAAIAGDEAQVAALLAGDSEAKPAKKKR